MRNARLRGANQRDEFGLLARSAPADRAAEEGSIAGESASTGGCYRFCQAPLHAVCNGYAMRRIVVGISGASGSAYGYMALQALRSIGGIETHLVLTASRGARSNSKRR